MGTKDTKAKEYLSDNGRFADLCNVVLFHGEQVVKAEELQEMDTTEVLSVFGTDRKEKHVQRWRDVLKQAVVRLYGRVYFMIIGAEHQTDVHYAMPVKNMLYDAMSYSRQVNETGRHHRENGEYGSGAEFLSGLHKTDKIKPVITITVYFGTKNWDGPRCLYDMFEETDERLKKFIPDYHVNLVVPQEMENFDQFQTTLGEVLELIKVSENRKAVKQLFDSNPKYRKMDRESISAINTFLGTNIPINKEEGSVTDMCKAWEDQREEDLKQGREEGRQEERRDLIGGMLSSGKTPEEIASFVNIPLAEVREVEKQLLVGSSRA